MRERELIISHIIYVERRETGAIPPRYAEILSQENKMYWYEQ